ncbi:unnamed protein product [Polarella glacialis]|uniref:Uncharacterized protein n=1 Tax=Polarella glacialis TaxID=89957 RepID=A0A813FUN5_POLGL|nr:unnamed protein product [Polarella glacialis]
MAPVSAWLWAVHCAGLMAAIMPASILLLPVPVALELMAPGDSLARSCGLVSGQGPDGQPPGAAVFLQSSSLPPLLSWLRGWPPAAEVFSAAVAPEVCGVAMAGLAQQALFDLMLALSLTAALLGWGAGGPPHQLQLAVISAWTCYGCVGAVVTGLARSGSGAWLQARWSLPCTIVLAGIGATGALSAYFLSNAGDVDNILPAAGPGRTQRQPSQPAPSRDGYMPVGARSSVPNAVSEQGAASSSSDGRVKGPSRPRGAG